MSRPKRISANLINATFIYLRCRNLKQAADADGISINHFVSLAVAEKLSAIQTVDITAERAKGASRSAFLHAMSLVPRGEIIDGDEPRPNRRRRHPTA
ncbi:MAG: hypothetical protein WCO57_12570 [Verrucomicrobiota bacterium]